MDEVALTIYSTPPCPKCNQAKATLDRKHIKYKKVNLFEDTEQLERFKENNMRELPIIQKANGKFVLGKEAVLYVNSLQAV